MNFKNTIRIAILTTSVGASAIAQTTTVQDHQDEEYKRQIRGALVVLLTSPDDNWGRECAVNLAKYEELLGFAQSPANRRNPSNAENMASGMLKQAAHVCTIEAASFCKVAVTPEAQEACSGYAHGDDDGDED